MGLFSRGPEKVISDGQRARGRTAAIEVSERTVPVVVSVKRADKVTIDWPSAVLAEPGIGVAPVTTVDQSRGAPRTLMSMGGPLAGAPVSSMGMSTPPPPLPPPAAFTPPAPVEGVTWAQYLTIERAILAKRCRPSPTPTWATRSRSTRTATRATRWC